VKGTFYYPNGYRIKSANDAGGSEHTGQVDYVNPLNGKHSVEAGLKYILRDNASRADHTYFDVTDNTWKPDPERKNDLDHTQKHLLRLCRLRIQSGKNGTEAGAAR